LNHRDAAGVGVGKRIEQDVLDDAEDRRRCSDAEGQIQDREQCK